jgi:hypothetical protein
VLALRLKTFRSPKPNYPTARTILMEQLDHPPHTVFCFSWLFSVDKRPVKMPIYKDFLFFATELFDNPTEANSMKFASVGSRFASQAHS